MRELSKIDGVSKLQMRNQTEQSDIEESQAAWRFRCGATGEVAFEPAEAPAQTFVELGRIGRSWVYAAPAGHDLRDFGGHRLHHDLGSISIVQGSEVLWPFD